MKRNSSGNLALVETEITADEQARPPAQSYSFAKFLRALGQALDAQNLAAFEMTYHSGVYVVRNAASQRSSLRNLLQSVVASVEYLLDAPAKKRPAGQSFEINYSHDDLVQLDNEGRSQRGLHHETPDPFTLAEKLRSVGSLIDADPKRSLVSVTNDGKQLKIRYEQESGEIQEETRRLEHHFRAWKGMFQQRKKRLKRAN